MKDRRAKGIELSSKRRAIRSSNLKVSLGHALRHGENNHVWEKRLKNVV